MLFSVPERKSVEKCRTFFSFRLSTDLKLMYYFLLHLLESSVAHHRPLISRTALALGRKEVTVCALQRAQTAWVTKVDICPSLIWRDHLLKGGHLLESFSRSKSVHPWVAQSPVVGLCSWALGCRG